MSNQTACNRAMILARGLGTRMQKDVDGVELDADTAKLASKGAKMLISIGRPFLDHSIQAMMDAGVKHFCLIVPPEAPTVRAYYGAVAANLASQGVTISFAVQEQAVGTANAVLAGKEWAAGQSFMVYNSDNWYSPVAVRMLASAPAPASLAFERTSLMAKSNISADRISRFAVMDLEGGKLRRIIEKPANPDEYADNGKLYVSMNCFLFTKEIFTACENITPDPVRKEYELPVAVQYCMDKLGQTFAAVRCQEGVLDMTGRADIEPVRKALAGHTVRFEAPKLEVL